MKKICIIGLIMCLIIGVTGLYAEENNDKTKERKPLNGWYISRNQESDLGKVVVRHYFMGMLDGLYEVNGDLMRKKYPGMTYGEIEQQTTDYYIDNPGDMDVQIVDIVLEGGTGGDR